MELLNVAQIFEENQKVIAKNYDKSQYLTNLKAFESFQHENLSQLLFPEKTQNLNGNLLHIAFMDFADSYQYVSFGKLVINCKWTFFLEIVAEQLNGTLNFTEIPKNRTSWEAYDNTLDKWIKDLTQARKLDFYLNHHSKLDLDSYNSLDWCFVLTVPPTYSIAELVLILPLDMLCWLWLLVTIAISTLIWRISEYHWNFFFGTFALIVGKSAEIKT